MAQGGSKVGVWERKAEANRWTQRAASIWRPAVPPVKPPVSQPVAAMQGWARRDGAPSFRWSPDWIHPWIGLTTPAHARLRVWTGEPIPGLAHLELTAAAAPAASQPDRASVFSMCRFDNGIHCPNREFTAFFLLRCWNALHDDLDLLSRGLPSLPAAPTFRSLRVRIFCFSPS